MIRVHIDFETRSSADLKTVGAWLYAEHPDTEVLCVAWCEDDERVDVTAGDYWHADPDRPEAIHSLDGIAADVLDGKAIMVAHNANFEQAIWQRHMVERFGFPPIPPERWQCTLAKALRHGLPGKLEKVGEWLDLPIQKDMEGNKIMQRLSKPRRISKKNPDKRWWLPEDAPEDFEKLYRYCVQDVETERLVDKALMDLAPDEQELWVIDQHINQHGVMLDMEAIHAALSLIEVHNKDLVEAFRAITDGINPTQRAKVLAWLNEQGVMCDNLRAETVDEILSGDNLTYDVRRAIELYQAANRTSLAKYGAMLERCSVDGVLREIIQFHGAHTGRWAGRGVQLQNLARPTTNVYAVVEAIKQCGVL